MNHLFHRLLGLALLLFLAVGASAQGHAMEVIFKPDMDKEALDRIRMDAKANGLELSYTRTGFSQGKLNALAFVLRTNKGSGSAETEGLSEDKPFGFRYFPKAGDHDAWFSVGTLQPLEKK